MVVINIDLRFSIHYTPRSSALIEQRGSVQSIWKVGQYKGYIIYVQSRLVEGLYMCSRVQIQSRLGIVYSRSETSTWVVYSRCTLDQYKGCIIKVQSKLINCLYNPGLVYISTRAVNSRSRLVQGLYTPGLDQYKSLILQVQNSKRVVYYRSSRRIVYSRYSLDQYKDCVLKVQSRLVEKL